MPYCKDASLIFVAIPKTGSTSMTKALRPLLQPYGGFRLLNEEMDEATIRSRRLREIGDVVPARATHLSALQIQYMVGEQEFQRCKRFSVVRNPWAKMMSKYFFKHINAMPSEEALQGRVVRRKFHELDFESWMDKRWKHYKAGKSRQLQLRRVVDLEGNMLVDHVGRLENIQGTLDWLRTEVGLGPIEMPHANSMKKSHYTEYYTEATREMVAEICREDIEFFGYRYGE